VAEAIEAEVAAWIDAHAHLRDRDGRRQVVRNRHIPERMIRTGIGPLEVKQPRVHDRRPRAAGEVPLGDSAALPAEDQEPGGGLIPWLYLKGVSTGDLADALQAILESTKKSGVSC